MSATALANRCLTFKECQIRGVTYSSTAARETASGDLSEKRRRHR